MEDESFAGLEGSTDEPRHGGWFSSTVESCEVAGSLAILERVEDCDKSLELEGGGREGRAVVDKAEVEGPLESILPVARSFRDSTAADPGVIVVSAVLRFGS